MFERKKTFEKKKIGELKNKNNLFDFGSIVRVLLVLLSIVFIIWVGKIAWGYTKAFVGNVSSQAVNSIVKQIGKEMIKDEEGNINVLLLGAGGTGHHGGYLSDTIIVASWNPESGYTSMVSIPRDFYIKHGNFRGRINGLMAYGYNQEHNVHSGANLINEKVEEIMGLEIPYYVVVSFEGFKDFIDEMGGIEVFVPQTIHDTKYPKDNLKGYEIFHLDFGEHILDGETALKYARSRHSTSDFDRSQRQQIIIKAIKDQVLKTKLSTKNIKKLYASYKNMLTTNISLDNMLWAYSYSKNNKIFSFGLISECSYKSYQLTPAGCFLYYPNREDFNGASVMLPMGASARNLGYYDYIHNFVDVVMYNQGFLEEARNIVIKNGIERDFARSKNIANSGWANKIAVKLKKYGFNIESIDNSEEKLENTTIYVSGTGEYIDTVAILETFGVPNMNVVTGAILEEGNMQIVLGNDFIENVANSGFSYETINK